MIVVVLVVAALLVSYWHATRVRLVRLTKYTYIVNVDPDRVRGEIDAGNIARAHGAYATAAECYRSAIRIDPHSAEAHGYLAAARFELADYQGAWEEVRLCRENGSELPADFIASLSRKMPEPE